MSGEPLCKHGWSTLNAMRNCPDCEEEVLAMNRLAAAVERFLENRLVAFFQPSDDPRGIVKRMLDR